MKRSILAPAVVVAVAVVTGGWFLQQGVEQEENVYLQVRLFEEVVDHIADHYVDEVERDDLYEQAIDGLLEELGDPNTSFIPASEYENFRIRTQGDYGGVGLEIVEQDGWVTVVSPIPGTPAARAGIRPGDRFATIEGKSAEGWSVDQAVDLLRGEPGTPVEVQMFRVGVDEPIPFTLNRAEIQLKAVPFTSMLEDGIGYVPLRVFRETSSAEVEEALDSLRAEGMRGLVLDLRQNPGGLLEEGIGVADLFLPPGLAVVETRGRARGQDESYAAAEPPAYGDLPMVVLVDQSSASASEIVAGALQDHDRALIVGNTSFGKGSVQTLFRLSGGNVFRLTTARWYTPSGRSIQADHGEQRVRLLGQDGALTLDGRFVERPDTADRPTFESVAGRTLYGGGGITPDVVVLPDTLGLSEQAAVRTLFRGAGAFNTALFTFAAGFIQDHPGLEPDFRVSDRVLDEFYATLEEQEVPVERETYRDAARFVRFQLGREIALQAWGETGEFERVRRVDPQLGRALELLGEAGTPEALFRIAGQGLPAAGSDAEPGERATGAEASSASEPRPTGGDER